MESLKSKCEHFYFRNAIKTKSRHDQEASNLRTLHLLKNCYNSLFTKSERSITLTAKGLISSQNAMTNHFTIKDYRRQKLS